MLLATGLALGAAVLHAAWNLAAKRADGDRFVVLWAQFAVAGVLAAVALVVVAVVEGMPASGYGWGALSGLVHLPYLWLLALAYTHGDFGVSYPLARGGGAALAALLGVALLGDHLTTGEVVGVVVIVGGLGLLSWGATARNAGLALGVAATIGAYTTIDAQGARSSGSAYVLATFTATAITMSIAGVATGRARCVRRGRAARRGVVPCSPGSPRSSPTAWSSSPCSTRRSATSPRCASRASCSAPSPAGASSARATTAVGSPPR